MNRNVSAVSRTDTKNEMVRSYVLLTANWRFGRFGGRGMMGRGRGEGRGEGGGPRGGFEGGRGGGGGFGGGGGRF